MNDIHAQKTYFEVTNFIFLLLQDGFSRAIMKFSISESTSRSCHMKILACYLSHSKTPSGVKIVSLAGIRQTIIARH